MKNCRDFNLPIIWAVFYDLVSRSRETTRNHAIISQISSLAEGPCVMTIKANTWYSLTSPKYYYTHRLCLNNRKENAKTVWSPSIKLRTFKHSQLTYQIPIFISFISTDFKRYYCERENVVVCPCCHLFCSIHAHVQLYWSLLNWQKIRFRFGSGEILSLFQHVLRYLRTLYIVWSLLRRRVTRRLTRLQTMYNVLKYRKTW